MAAGEHPADTPDLFADVNSGPHHLDHLLPDRAQGQGAEFGRRFAAVESAAMFIAAAMQWASLLTRPFLR